MENLNINLNTVCMLLGLVLTLSGIFGAGIVTFLIGAGVIAVFWYLENEFCCVPWKKDCCKQGTSE